MSPSFAPIERRTGFLYVRWVSDGVERGAGEAGAADVLAAARDLAATSGRPFRKGEVLFHDGDAGNEALLLVEGKVRLLKRVRLSERSLGVLRPGDLLGEGALRGVSTRSATAIALTDGLAVVLDVKALRTLIGSSPALGARLIAELVRRLTEAEDQVELLLLRDTESKVVSALLKAAGSAQETASVVLSPVDLSAKVALDVEIVKAAVQRLRDQGYLRVSADRVEIPDVQALRRLYALLGAKEELRGER